MQESSPESFSSNKEKNKDTKIENKFLALFRFPLSTFLLAYLFPTFVFSFCL